MLVTVVSAMTMCLFIYAIWHILFSALSVCAAHRIGHICSKTGTLFTNSSLRVAILMPVCDDFDSEAANIVVAYKDKSHDMFILDDSVSEVSRNEIDAWTKQSTTKVTVVRRPSRVGFKAGNINCWLKHYGREGKYEYIFVLDSDERLSKGYLQRLLGYAHGKNPAFVQGCHKARPGQSWFEDVLGLAVATGWHGQLPGRNLCGVPPILGHGVLLNVADIVSVGGIPEVVSEDLALTIMLAEKGRKGLLCNEVTAEERFPSNMTIHRQRLQRYIAADTQVCRRYMPLILFGGMKLGDKADVLLRETRLPALAIFFHIALVCAVVAAYHGGSLFSLEGTAIAASFPLLWSGQLPALWVGDYSRKRRISFMLCAPFFSCGCFLDYIPSFWRGVLGNLGFQPTNGHAMKKRGYVRVNLVMDCLVGALLICGGVSGKLLLFIAFGVALISVAWFTASDVKWPVAGFLAGTFWMIVLSEVFCCISSGFVPVEDLLLVGGLAAARD